ncbi:hypothetical protein EPN52_13925 [bacterium]|nr:MAG: hypothetical protein EPN52_13925 [bacterium]
MWRYLLAATAVVVGLMLLFLALPLRAPHPDVRTGTPVPGPRATLPIYPHSQGGAISGEAPWAFDALPSCFTPRWEWQPGSDRVEERVHAHAIEALARGHVEMRVVIDSGNGTRLTARAAAAALRGPALAPLPAGTEFRSGNCALHVDITAVTITRGGDHVSVPAARLYLLRRAGETLVVVAHDAPLAAEVGAYLPHAMPHGE